MAEEKCPDAAVLAEYAVGRLGEAESEAVAAHLERCPCCQAELETVHDADDTLVRRLREPAPEEPFLEESHCNVALARAKALAGGPEAGNASAGDDPSVLGGTLGEYRLLKRLGHGGMGTVYQALHTKLDRVVALKVLPKGRLEDRQAVARFEREMKAAARLDHPNIVKAYDAREIDDMPVLIMEYVEGMDLGELARRVGPLPLADACELARQAALALEHVHEHGLVHRDVKPSNLMLTRQGELKLLDVGLARFHLESPGGEVTDTGQAMGTADYMAPEQVSSSRDVDIRADVYSLGCTLFRLLAGRAPFGGPEYPGNFEKMTAHVEKPVPPIRERAPEVPPALAGLLDRMLAKEPDGRPATPAEVAEALAPFCRGHGLPNLVKQAEQKEPLVAALAPDARPGVPCPAPSTKARRSIRLPVAIALMLLSFVVGFALGIVITIQKDGQQSQVVVPEGAKVNLDEQGNVHVTLPPGTEVVGQARKTPAAPSDEAAIRGLWQIVDVRDSGRQAPADEVKGMQFVFTENRAVMVDLKHNRVERSASYVLDPKREPKGIDLELPGDGKKMPGIYKLEGDRLWLCLNERGPDRPTAFASVRFASQRRDSPNDLLMILRRAGDAKAARERLEAVEAEQPEGQAKEQERAAIRDLKQVGIAMHNFHDIYKRFPPARTSASKTRAPQPDWPPHSWRVALLPFIDRADLYEQYHFDEPWDSPANKKVLDQMPDVYRHPDAPAGSTHTAYFVLTGPGTIFDGEDGTPIREILDGTSNTILVVEAKRDIPWTKPEDIPFDPEKPLPELGGFPEGGFHAALADGSARFIPESMDEAMLRSAFQKADRRIIVWPETP